MSRTVRIALIGIGIVMVAALAVSAYIYVRGGSGEPSATISAPTLAIAAEPTSEPTTAAAESATEAVPAEAATEDATENTSASADFVIFAIDPEQSEVSFTLTEELRGQPTTVVGTTDQVAGQIGVNFDHPQATQIGEIRINARTLATDQEMRNRMIRGEILQSAQDQYEFISFTPTALTGLPDTVTIGEPIQFQITGDLTIREITQSITFDAVVTPISETQLQGTATTTVQRGDFELRIPSVPQVANVSEDVQIEINFVAMSA